MDDVTHKDITELYKYWRYVVRGNYLMGLSYQEGVLLRVKKSWKKRFREEGSDLYKKPVKSTLY